MSKASPTQLSLRHARNALGWTAAVCERWNPFARIRQDLFGFDILAICPDRKGVTGIQTTSGGSGGHHANRAAKLAANSAVRRWIESGNVAEVWSWSKDRAGRWALRRSELRIEDLQPVDLTPRPKRRGRKICGLFDNPT